MVLIVLKLDHYSLYFVFVNVFGLDKINGSKCYQVYHQLTITIPFLSSNNIIFRVKIDSRVLHFVVCSIYHFFMGILCNCNK